MYSTNVRAMLPLTAVCCPAEDRTTAAEQRIKREKMSPSNRKCFADKPAFARLLGHFQVAESQRGVQWEHQLGMLVNELCPRNVRVYGQHSIELLAKELAAPSYNSNRLWLSRKLSEAIAATDLTQLVGKADKSGFNFTISHVLSLVSIKDDDERIAVGKLCVERQWGVKQLRREIHRRQGKKSQGGLSLAEPENVDVALQDLLERSRDWLNRYEKIWFAGGTGCLARPMSKAAATRLEQELEDAEKVLREMRAAVDIARKGIRTQRPRAAKPTQMKGN